MISYQGPELELYKEGVRTIPALLAARVRGCPDDAMLVMRAYMREAEERGIGRESAWAVLFSAAQITIASLLEALAYSESAEQEVIVQRMIAAAQQSVGSGAL